MSRAPNGSGSIYQRPNGSWVGALYVQEADGARRRRRVYGKTKAEVADKVAELRRKEAAKVPITPHHLTVGGYLREWLDEIVAARVRPRTLDAYRHYVESYLEPEFGRTRLGALTARDLRRYLERLKAQGAGVRTIRYVHATLRAALEDAMREELIDKNVAKLVRAPSVPVKPREPLTMEEVRLFLKANTEDRLWAMYVVFALLGLRRSEVLGLLWSDVDLAAGTLSIRRGLQRVDGELRTFPTKTRRSERTIPLPGLVIAALDARRENQIVEFREFSRTPTPGDFVFTTMIGTPLDPDNVSKLVRRAMDNAGVRHVRLHDFRHGAVSTLLALGVPPRTVMEIVGHSGLEMTMNVYAHVSLDDKKAALDQLGRLLEEGDE